MSRINTHLICLFLLSSPLVQSPGSVQVWEDGRCARWGEERNQRDSATGRCVGRGGAKKDEQGVMG